MRVRVLFPLVPIVLLLLSGCQTRYTEQPAAPDPGERLREIKAQRSEYRDIQQKLASLKKEVKEHVHVFEMSRDTEDPLNHREDPIAHAQIIETANSLKQQCEAALGNEAMLKVVSGSKRNLRRYQAYAQRILKKYDTPQSAAAPDEPPPIETPVVTTPPDVTAVPDARPAPATESSPGVTY